MKNQARMKRGRRSSRLATNLGWRRVDRHLKRSSWWCSPVRGGRRSPGTGFGSFGARFRHFSKGERPKMKWVDDLMEENEGKGAEMAGNGREMPEMGWAAERKEEEERAQSENLKKNCSYL